MLLGMTLAQFTVFHVAISMLAIFVGFMVVGGMLSNTTLAGWTVLFLILTILTNVTGFMFPINGVTPGLAIGALSSLLLIVALIALYVRRLVGPWRAIYIVTALLGLYFNVLVLIVQSFQKVSFLTPLAPTGSEPAVLIAQVINLISFLLIGWFAFGRFRPRIG